MKQIENEKLSPFNDIYRNKKVLITGNTGFKGSWLNMPVECSEYPS